MQELEYRQRSQQLVDLLRANNSTFEVQLETGPEQLAVELAPVDNSEGVYSYLLVMKNPKGEEVATTHYRIDTTVEPPLATVVSIDVVPQYQSKHIGQEMLRLLAKDAEARGVKRVVTEVHKDNPPGLIIWQHTREILTGRRYHTEHAQSPTSRAFYDVTTFLDQFEDEHQGET